MFQSASKHAIFIERIEKKSWQPSQTPTPAGEGSRTHALGAYGAFTLAPSALNSWSACQSPKYATTRSRPGPNNSTSQIGYYIVVLTA